MPLFIATANLLLNFFTNVDGSYVPPATAQFLLLRAVPDGTETGSQLAALEVTSADYAPVTVDWDDTFWGAADDTGTVTQILNALFGDTTLAYEEAISAVACRDGATGTDSDVPMVYWSRSAITPPADSTPALAIDALPLAFGLGF